MSNHIEVTLEQNVSDINIVLEFEENAVNAVMEVIDPEIVVHFEEEKYLQYPPTIQSQVDDLGNPDYDFQNYFNTLISF